MGNSNSKRCMFLKRQFPNFRIQDWEQIKNQSHSERNGVYGKYSVFRNSITLQVIGRYHLIFPTYNETKIYEKCFIERLRDDYIVNAYHYEPQYNETMCSAFYSAIVYIQHMPIRLINISDIPLPQSLYILKCSLLGFEKLFHSTGYFEVMEEHICIDKQGHVRVWMNADLSKNYPQYGEEEIEENQISQCLMVRQVVEQIEKNSEKCGEEMVTLSEYCEYKTQQFPNFREAIELLHQYVKQYGIQLPHYCESVTQIFQEEYGDSFDISFSGFDDFQQMENQNINQNVYSREQGISSVSNFQEPMIHYDNQHQMGKKLQSSRVNYERIENPFQPNLILKMTPREMSNFESLNSSLKFVEEQQNRGQFHHLSSNNSRKVSDSKNYQDTSRQRSSHKHPIVRFSYTSSNRGQIGPYPQQIPQKPYHQQFSPQFYAKQQEQNPSFLKVIENKNINEKNIKKITQEAEQEKDKQSLDEEINLDISRVTEELSIDQQIFKDLMKLYPIELHD